MKFKVKYIFLFLPPLMYSNLKAQSSLSNLDKGLVIGNILIQGYMAIKGNGAKAINHDAKTVESFCFKNKMDEKITVKLNGKIEEEEIKKEFVIQKDEKECTVLHLNRVSAATWCTKQNVLKFLKLMVIF